MPRQRLAAWILTPFILAAPGLAPADVLAPFTAIYQVELDNTPLGRARFTLAPQGENCYLYSGVAKPEGLAALLVGETSEQSHFCVTGGKIRPVSYQTREDGDKGDNYALKFDWVNRWVRTDEGEPRKLSAEGVDPLSLQIALRKLLSDAGGNPPAQAFSLVVVEDDKEKTYRFAIGGREALKTPIGELDTMRVDRIDDSKRQLRLWLAPSLQYLPVRVEQQRGKGAVTRLKIETLPDSPAD